MYSHHYSDHELEVWGEMYCKHRLRERTGILFISFMALSAPIKRMHIRMCLARAVGESTRGGLK